MDITDDNIYATLFHVCKKGVPDYVRKSPALTKEASADLPDSLFADRANRRYPIDSKANTWLSAAYFAKTAEQDGYGSETFRKYVEDVIKLAADKYGIRKDVDEVMGRIREKPVEKKAEDDLSNYGWPEQRKYPMFDERGVKLANTYFAENAFKYPPSVRKEIASNIMRKSAEYGISPHERVRVESCQGVNKRDFVAAQLIDRVKAGSRGNLKLAMAFSEATKAMMRTSPKNYVDLMEKFSELISKYDDANGFSDHYGVKFHSPAEILHGMSIKEAEALRDDTVVMKGHAFSIEKLAELPLEVFTDALGDDFGDRVKSAEGIDKGKLADELHSMPEPDKGALLRSIRQYTA